MATFHTLLQMMDTLHTEEDTNLHKIYGISAEIRQKCEFEIGN